MLTTVRGSKRETRIYILLDSLCALAETGFRVYFLMNGLGLDLLRGLGLLQTSQTV